MTRWRIYAMWSDCHVSILPGLDVWFSTRQWGVELRWLLWGIGAEYNWCRCGECRVCRDEDYEDDHEAS